MEEDLPRESVIDGNITYRDQDHLSLTGVKVFGERLVRNLAPQGYGELLPPREGPPLDAASTDP